MTATVDPELLPHHRRELCEGSGLARETIASAGIHSETNATKVRMMLNWSKMAPRMASGIIIPFRDASGNLTGYSRFKPDSPRNDRHGKPIKYESPRGVPNRAYFPPRTIDTLRDPTIQLLVTEGEKKSLKADQEGFPCIGLTGVFAWKEKAHERLIPDLELIEWKGRRVKIVFDSDATEKENVADAERRFAAQLSNRGADVLVVRLPIGPNGEKVGLDDFLVANGAPALHQLLNEAIDADPVDVGTDKADARAVDAMLDARRMLAATAMYKEGREEILRLRTYRGSPWWFTGTHYREEADADMEAKVVQYLDTGYYRLTRAAVTNVMMALRSETIVSSHREMPTWLDGQTGGGNWLPMANGILNLTALLKGETDVIVPHTPRYFSTTCLPYVFDPHANCPIWLRLLDRNLEGDHERIAILQQYFGYSLSSALSLQKFLFMEGEGANGKSVACAVLAAMLGNENVSSVALESFGERFSLFHTLGKLANIVAEVGDIDRVAEGHLKAFTSGDAMQFERKHKDPITARPTAKLVFASNNRPRFSDKSGGLWRRMILMPWRVVIPESEKVHGMDQPKWWQDQGELPGILLWAIAGLGQLLQQGGFTKSTICDAALAEYKIESNPIRMFLEERFHFDPDSWVPCEDAYGLYVGWVKSNGFLQASDTSFGREVKRAFTKVERKKRTLGIGDRPWCYLGLAMT